jgi:hypothetical protein
MPTLLRPCRGTRKDISRKGLTRRTRYAILSIEGLEHSSEPVGYFDANETTPPALFSIFLKISGSKDKQFIEGFGLYITRIGSPSGHPIH